MNEQSEVTIVLPTWLVEVVTEYSESKKIPVSKIITDAILFYLKIAFGYDRYKP
ncbi:hypothetical protein NIES4103_27970 [Nostoc sp. NIES-4103]|nr:hypothetical protein NIES4103_27970 [Nostoc sp. NIES-4103]